MGAPFSGREIYNKATRWNRGVKKFQRQRTQIIIWVANPARSKYLAEKFMRMA